MIENTANILKVITSYQRNIFYTDYDCIDLLIQISKYYYRFQDALLGRSGEPLLTNKASSNSATNAFNNTLTAKLTKINMDNVKIKRDALFTILTKVKELKESENGAKSEEFHEEKNKLYYDFLKVGSFKCKTENLKNHKSNNYNFEEIRLDILKELFALL